MADSPLPRCNEKIVAGNVVLEGIDFSRRSATARRSPWCWCFYAGGLQICMQYDSRRITEAQADDLLATYLRKIRTSLDMTSRTAQNGIHAVTELKKSGNSG